MTRKKDKIAGPVLGMFKRLSPHPDRMHMPFNYDSRPYGDHDEERGASRHAQLADVLGTNGLRIRNRP